MAKNVKNFKSIAQEMGLVLGNGLIVKTALTKKKRPRIDKEIRIGTLVGSSDSNLDLSKCFSTLKIKYEAVTYKILEARLEVPTEETTRVCIE